MNKNYLPHNQKITSGNSPDDINIQDIANIIWYQKKILLTVIILGTIMSFLFSASLDSKYTSYSKILINSNDVQDKKTDIVALAKTFNLDVGYILTEVEILKSRSLAGRVIEKLKLNQDPEFNTNLNANNDVLNSSGISTNLTLSTQDNLIVITNFLKALNVTPISGSLAVQISFSSSDPQKSALINNTLIEEYIEQRSSNALKIQDKISTWLEKRIEDLKQKIVRLETEAQKYRIENNLIPGKNILLSAEDLTLMNNQRLVTEHKYNELKAKFDEISKSNNKIMSVEDYPNSVNSELMKTLNNQKLKIETTISEISNRYGPKHPIMIEKKSELQSINQKINDQVGKSKDSLKNELNIAKAELDKIENSISYATDKNNIDSTAMIKLREIERESETSRNILKTFLEKYKGSFDKNLVQDTSTQIISYADTPLYPSSPDKKLMFLLGVIVSIIFGLVISFLNEKTYNKFRTAEDLESKYGTSCIASIPYRRIILNKNLVSEVLSKPVPNIIEAIHNLRLSLNDYQTDNRKQPKVVAFLSSFKNEGKTVTASLLAALSAKAGERVILIDTNLRTPSVHNAFDRPNTSNLVDYLTGQKELQDIIHKDKESGLNLIFGSSVPNSAYNLLSLEKLDHLIEALKQNYDLIIMDTPACLNASDARLVEQLSDVSLYCVRSNSTKEKMVTKGIKTFLNRPQNNLVFILTHSK